MLNSVEYPPAFCLFEKDLFSRRWLLKSWCAQAKMNELTGSLSEPEAESIQQPL